MTNVKVKDMVKAHLAVNGYGGLFDAGLCACELDDLAPCGCGMSMECQAGYKVPCNDEGLGDGGFCIVPKMDLRGQYNLLLQENKVLHEGLEILRLENDGLKADLGYGIRSITEETGDAE